MLRPGKIIALTMIAAAACALADAHRAFSQVPHNEHLSPSVVIQDDGPAYHDAPPLGAGLPTPAEFGAGLPIGSSGGLPNELGAGLPTPPPPPPSYWPSMGWLGLRHSYTHGRSVGLGDPLVATSWLNRPYYAGFDIGPLWMTRSVEDSVSRDTDLFGGIFLGCDWDHYWGTELAFHWATPELINSDAPDANRTDSLFIWSYSAMYYPWGDSAIRPYWRVGLGNTHIDFPLDDGSRHDEWLFTMPIGVGVKCSPRRWLAARAELTDHIAFGDSDVHTQHNLTLTCGLEWRFGVHPRSYWPWHPSRHIW